MKKKLKRKFLPTVYYPIIFLELHYLEQKEKIIEEYTNALDHFMIKCDLSKAKEHTIASSLGGMRSEISNGVCMHV